MGTFNFFLYSFLINALIATLLTSLTTSAVGVFVVQKKMSTMGAAVAHSSLAGAILALLLKINPLLGAFILSILFSFLISYIGKKEEGRMDVMLGLVFGLSTALAVLFLSLTSTYSVSAWQYIIGDVLSVTIDEINILLTLTFTTLLLITLLFKGFKFIVFDEETAEAMGLRTDLLRYTLTMIVAIVTVISLKVVGSILTIILLVAPAASAYEFSHSFEKAVILAELFALTSGLTGLIASIYLNVSASAITGIIAVFTYFLSYIFSTKRRKCKCIVKQIRVIKEKTL